MLAASMLPATSGQAESLMMNSTGMLFSGSLSNPLPMNSEDPQIAIWIHGPEAEALFKQLENQGPKINGANKDPLHECIDYSNSPLKVMSRGKGAIRCELSREGEYSCALGADLGKGKSKLGLIC